MILKMALIDPIAKTALREDIGKKDLTTSLLIPKDTRIRAEIQANESGVLCGIEVAERVFRLVDEDLRFLPAAKDADEVEKGREIAYLEGSAQSVLVAERTALNFLCHLSGIATRTREFVQKVKHTQAKILDTRKTTPGLRLLEKYAVRAGGGVNHRFGLFDEILIKDNHLRVLRQLGLSDIVARARRGVLKKTVIGLEAKNLKEFAEALKTSVDYILLDNMSVADAKEALALRHKIRSGVPLEISGGISLENVRDYAELGVERISVGCLTHDVPGLDISLNIVG